jgi:hypothetical protein
MNINGRNGKSYKALLSATALRWGWSADLSCALQGYEETMRDRGGLLVDCILPKPPRLVPISQNSRIRSYRRQHLCILEPVDISRCRLVLADILAPGVVGVCTDAMYRHYTTIRSGRAWRHRSEREGALNDWAFGSCSF